MKMMMMTTTTTSSHSVPGMRSCNRSCPTATFQRTASHRFSATRGLGAYAPVRSCGVSLGTVRTLLEGQRSVAGRAVHRDAYDLPEVAWVNNTLTWQRPDSSARVAAPPNAPPVVILPGFGNCTADYTVPFGNQQAAIATQLQERGWNVFVVPVERKDWFKVARAILTLRFWKSALTTDPGYTWYLDRVAETVERAAQETGSQQVDLVGHSAGGWLGRAYIGDPKYRLGATASSGGVGTSDVAVAASSSAAVLLPNPRVRSLVTLGTPQRPPPPEKKRDMTGGAQGWVDRTYPGAFFNAAGVRYACVVGRTVRGHRDFPRQREGPRVAEEYAYDSYMEVCGDGEGVEGDCVVPLSSSLLDGAEHIVLDGVYHSMSRIGTFDDESGVVWYGSDAVIDSWLHVLASQPD